MTAETPTARLAAVRAQLAAQGLQGFIVPRADEHLGEYVPLCAERLAWLTGFTGSAGLAVVLAERAAVFTDGRYTLQLAAQTDPALWERCHLIERPPPAWIARHAAAGARIGYDPRLISAEALARYAEAGLSMVAVEANPIDLVWTDRPPPPSGPVEVHGLALAGVASAEKRAAAAARLRAAGQDAVILTDPASIAWLLNVRGSDLPCTPVALGFAILASDGTVQLFMEPAKLGAQARAWLGDEVSVAAPALLAPALDALAGRCVRVDRAATPVWFAQRLERAGARVADGPDPTLLPRACKNTVEQEGARAAHARDAQAVIRFLHWLDCGRAPDTTEQAASDRLLAFRRALPGFREESFPAISGAGPNGAIIHYRVTPATDRVLGKDEAYLIDSGAQFPEGTTDITRTIWTGPGPAPARLRDQATRVLQGLIAIATLVFPQGTTGLAIDALARRALWQAGLDYDHGTGHGVGSYLSVHEGPTSLSPRARPVALAEGMILSDEPGYYEAGSHGIRLENLLLVRPAPAGAGGRSFLRFETLTLAPFDRRLIDPALLTGPERAWLDEYHARVLREAGPGLEEEVRTWLVAACAPMPARAGG